MEMTSKAEKIQNELDQLDEEIKSMRQTQKAKREMMYAELGKEFYKATGSKSYAEAFSKIRTVCDTSMNVSQSTDFIDKQDIQFLMNTAYHMTKGDNGNWRLSREELQTLVNRIHEMFVDASDESMMDEILIDEG